MARLADAQADRAQARGGRQAREQLAQPLKGVGLQTLEKGVHRCGLSTLRGTRLAPATGSNAGMHRIGAVVFFISTHFSIFGHTKTREYPVCDKNASHICQIVLAPASCDPRPGLTASWETPV
jgi:hypothetical protein